MFLKAIFLSRKRQPLKKRACEVIGGTPPLLDPFRRPDQGTPRRRESSPDEDPGHSSRGNES